MIMMIDDGKTSQHCFRIFYGNIPNVFSVFFFFKWEHSQQFLIPSFSFNPLSGCQVSTALMLQGLADCQGQFINQKLIQLFLSASHFQAVPSFLIYSFFLWTIFDRFLWNIFHRYILYNKKTHLPLPSSSLSADGRRLQQECGSGAPQIININPPIPYFILKGFASTTTPNTHTHNIKSFETLTSGKAQYSVARRNYLKHTIFTAVIISSTSAWGILYKSFCLNKV